MCNKLLPQHLRKYFFTSRVYLDIFPLRLEPILRAVDMHYVMFCLALVWQGVLASSYVCALRRALSSLHVQMGRVFAWARP